MSITFGSVGDIISISLIVKDLIKSLDDSRGSISEYREVIRDLWELDTLLLQVELVWRSYEQTAELNALCITAKSIVQSCRECVEKFKESIKKYDSSLGSRSRRNVIMGVSMKIRWQVCHKDDLDKFRATINAHCASLNLLLTTATLNVVSLNDKKLQDRQTASEEKDQKAAETQNSLLLVIRDRLVENTELIISTTDKLDQGLKLLWLRKLGTELMVLVKKIFMVNIAIYRTVSEIRASLPSHLERPMYQEPFHLEDAIGRVIPVHLQFISTWDAFDSVLETRFRNLQGHKKILDKDFVLQERTTKRDISRDLPWEGAFLPGQKIDMSMVFVDSRDERQKCCPGCRKVCEDCPQTGTQCSHCGMWFGRVIELIDSDSTESMQPSAQVTKRHRGEKRIKRPITKSQPDEPLPNSIYGKPNGREHRDTTDIEAVGDEGDNKISREHVSQGDPTEYYSVTSSITSYESENGRTYHAVRMLSFWHLLPT
ncbi:hypothetical protein EG329_012750 [Mollisiaceae sp. DMI_Dod_QoI]|nr:hypothetical protein EG329_012750 [Helotiales sp. DMI_Dod_QoI]